MPKRKQLQDGVQVRIPKAKRIIADNDETGPSTSTRPARQIVRPARYRDAVEEDDKDEAEDFENDSENEAVPEDELYASSGSESSDSDSSELGEGKPYKIFSSIRSCNWI